MRAFIKSPAKPPIGRVFYPLRTSWGIGLSTGVLEIERVVRIEDQEQAVLELVGATNQPPRIVPEGVRRFLETIILDLYDVSRPIHHETGELFGAVKHEDCRRVLRITVGETESGSEIDGGDDLSAKVD
jgi:hypothetical protein